MRKKKDGKPYRIPHEELGRKWIKTEKDGKKFWEHITNHKTSNDGKYIDDDNGINVTRDWMDIAMDVLILIARALSPVRWLHHFKAINLGEHVSKWINGIYAMIWGLVLTIGAVSSIRDAISEADLQEIRKQLWNAVQAVIDLIALLFDFGLGSLHPGLRIAGRALNIVAASSLLAKNAVYY